MPNAEGKLNLGRLNKKTKSCKLFVWWWLLRKNIKAQMKPCLCSQWNMSHVFILHSNWLAKGNKFNAFKIENNVRKGLGQKLEKLT